jgi:hypothetical protein
MKTLNTNNFQLLGKDGVTTSSCIQKHKPEVAMNLIQLESGHFLFCQKNHPVIIKSSKNNNEMTIEANDVRLNDYIYVNNLLLFNREDDYIPDLKLNEFLNNDLTIFEFDENFVSYHKDWCLYFILHLIQYSIENKSILKTLSKNIILLQQIKLIADKCDLYFSYEFDKDIDNNLIINNMKCSMKKEIQTSINDYSKVVSILTDIKYDNYVYDIKTESEEFLISCVQTHNSFHTSGAANISRVKIIDELMNKMDESYRTSISTIFKQVENDLILQSDFIELRIPKNIYDDKYKITKKNDNYQLPLGYFLFKYNSFDIPCSIEQPVLIYTNDNAMEDIEQIIIQYKKGDKILNIEPIPHRAEKVAQHLDELLGGKSPFTTPEELYMKIYKVLKPIGLGADSVHLEVAISNILRNKKNPQLPARLKEPYEFQTFSIKTLPSKLSWSLGLAFENFSKSISEGLIADRAEPSSIEKILFGEPLSELSINQLKEEKRRKNK